MNHLKMSFIDSVLRDVRALAEEEIKKKMAVVMYDINHVDFEGVECIQSMYDEFKKNNKLLDELAVLCSHVSTKEFPNIPIPHDLPYTRKLFEWHRVLVESDYF